MGLQAPICSGASEVSLRSCKGSAGADLQALPAALPGAKPSWKGLLIMKGKILAITAKKEMKIECFFPTRDCSCSRTEVTHGVSQQHVVHRSVYDHCANHQHHPRGFKLRSPKPITSPSRGDSRSRSLAWVQTGTSASRHHCRHAADAGRLGAAGQRGAAAVAAAAVTAAAAWGSGGGGGSAGQLQAARVVGLCSAYVGKRLASVISPRDSARPAPKHREFWTSGEDVRCLISGLFTPSRSFWRSP